MAVLRPQDWSIGDVFLDGVNLNFEKGYIWISKTVRKIHFEKNICIFLKILENQTPTSKILKIFKKVHPKFYNNLEMISIV